MGVQGHRPGGRRFGCRRKRRTAARARVPVGQMVARTGRARQRADRRIRVVVLHLIVGRTAVAVEDQAAVRLAEAGVIAVQIEVRLIHAAAAKAGQHAAAGAAPAAEAVDQLHFRAAAVEDIAVGFIFTADPLLPEVIGKADERVVLHLCVLHRSLGKLLVHHRLKVLEHIAQQIVRFRLRDGNGDLDRAVVRVVARAVADAVLAVIPDRRRNEALLILNELDARLADLQGRQRRPVVGVGVDRGRIVRVRLVGVIHRSGRPVRVDRVVLRNGIGIAKVRTAVRIGVPAGKIPPAVAGRGEAAVCTVQRVAQNGVVGDLAAVAVVDHVAEAHLVRHSVVAAVKEELDLAQAAVEPCLREVVALLDPGAERVGDLQLGIAAAADHRLHLVTAAQDRSVVADDEVHQRVKLLLIEGHAVARDKAIDRTLRAGEVLVASGDLPDKGLACLARRKGRRGKGRYYQLRRKAKNQQKTDQDSFHDFTPVGIMSITL